jgi:outer membrane protein
MLVRLLAAALVALPAAPALALPPDCGGAKACSVDLTAEQMFELAERRAARGRVDDAAALLDALTADTRPPIRTEAYFRLGKLRHDMGEFARAVAAFEAALTLAPDAPPIRLELARSLAAMGDNRAASRQLRRAQSAGLPEDVARAVDRISSALLRDKKLGGSIEIGVAPDSNINRATSADTIDVGGLPLALDADARSKSGLGATFAAQGFWRPALGERAAWLSRLVTGGSLYGDADFNDIVVSGATGPEFVTGGGRTFFALTASRRWFGGERYSDRYGGTVEWLLPLTRTSQLDLRLSAVRQRFRQNDAQNGAEYAADVRYERALTPRLYLRAGVQAARTEARADEYALTAIGGDLLLSRDLGPLTAFASSGYRWTRGDGVFLLFGDRRRDDRVDLTAGAVWKALKLFGLSPLARIAHTRNASSLTLYDFRQTRLELALSREF